MSGRDNVAAAKRNRKAVEAAVGINVPPSLHEIGGRVAAGVQRVARRTMVRPRLGAQIRERGDLKRFLKVRVQGLRAQGWSLDARGLSLKSRAGWLSPGVLSIISLFGRIII